MTSEPKPLAWLSRWINGPADPPGAPFAAARRRLIVTTVAVVAIVMAVLGLAIFIINQNMAQEQTIELLKYYATTGGSALHDNDGKPSGTDGDSGPLVPYSPSSSDTFLIVLDPAGHTTSDRDHIEHLGVPVVAAAQPVLSGQQQEISPTVSARGHTYQLYITNVHHDNQLAAVVVAGTSLERQQREADDLLLALGITYGVALLLTFLTSLFVTERALRPARLAFIRQRQFATAASHELKTPLAVIRSEAELASGLIGDGLATLRGPQANHDAPEQAGRYLEEALRETHATTAEVDYMTRMVQGMLMLARDATDTLAHPWSDVDLRTLLEDVTDRMRPLAEQDGLTIQMPELATTRVDERQPQTVLVRGDADLLRQLFFGLLENAMRYTPAGGVIRVDIRAEKHAHLLGNHRRHAYVSISDTGMGIAPEHLPHIFEPFYRVVSAARPLHETQHGTGLGLALAQWIVRAHGGDISVQSTVGSGTTFTVALPLERTTAGG